MAEPADPSLTPEKRLLDLIEEPETLNKEVSAGAKKSGLTGFFSPAAFAGIFSGFQGGFGPWMAKHKASFGIKGLNKILKIIVMVLALVMVVDFIVGYIGTRQDFAGSIKVPESKMFDVTDTKESAKGASSVESWDLGKMFMPYGKRQEEANRIIKEQSSRLVEMTKNLKLTGISYNPTDPKRVFCMIEDVEKNITTFLREGDPIGMLKVIKIDEDRVVLESGDETVELH